MNWLRSTLARRATIVLGVALYLYVLAGSVLSLMEHTPGVRMSTSMRVHGATSDFGLVATLVVAAPVVLFVAFKNWNRRPPA
ncbi:MAG: hypothetical protein AB7J28_09425 [Hyphomonadaceae bacterium]